MRNKLTFLAATHLIIATATLAQWDFEQANHFVQGQPLGGKGLAVDSIGNVFVLPIFDGDLYFRTRNVETGNWLESELVSDPNVLAEVLEAAITWNSSLGAPIIAYEQNLRIWLAVRDGAEWARTPLSEEGETEWAPDIAANDSGIMYVVWVDQDSEEFQLNYAYFDGNVWERNDIEAELGAFGSGAAPRVAVDANGAAHVIFRGVVNGLYAAQHATNDTAGNDNWIVTTLQTPHPENYPGDIVVGGDGRVHCITSGSEGFGMQRQAYYHERDALGNWEQAVSVSEDIPASAARLALNSDNAPHSVWLEQSGNFFSGIMGYSTVEWGWEVGLPYGNADGDIAFAIDGQDYGHIVVSDLFEDFLYVRSIEPLALPEHWPEIALLPDTIVYDTIMVGELQAIMGWVHNTGEVDLELFRGFTIGDGFWGGGVLHLIGDNGPMIGTDIRFEPRAPGEYSGWWVVESTALTSPDSAFLFGVAVEDTAVIPEIRITPDRVNFDSVRIGEDSTMQISLLNVGGDMLTVTEFFVEGSTFFGPTWSAQDIEPGASLPVEVRFAPTERSRYQGHIMIYSNAMTSPDSIPMEGFGIENLGAPDTPLPLAFELKPLYPNPFNGAVKVSFSLPRASDVSLRVYDVLGREVGRLINGTLNAGEHQAEWNCAECAAGIYLFRLEAAGRTMVQKAVYLK